MWKLLTHFHITSWEQSIRKRGLPSALQLSNWKLNAVKERLKIRFYPGDFWVVRMGDWEILCCIRESCHKCTLKKKNFFSESFIFPPQKEAVLEHTWKRKDYNSVVTLENFYLTSGLWYAHFKMTSLFEKGRLVNRGVPSQWCASTVHCLATISVD